MLDENAIAGLPGTPLLDADGREVGPIDDVFAFPATGMPATDVRTPDVGTSRDPRPGGGAGAGSVGHP